jgi:hypothetical protein
MWHVWEAREVYKGLWWETWGGVDGKIILKWFFKKWDWEAWFGLLWLRVGTAGRRL